MLNGNDRIGSPAALSEGSLVKNHGLWNERRYVEQEEITTERLVLRGFVLEDAADVQRLAGEWDVARTTLNVPHPYEDGMAEAWIGTHQKVVEDGLGYVYAITLREEGRLIGAINAAITEAHRQAEFGYWIGKPFWRNGYCSEAASALVEYCFDTLELNRVHAHHVEANPASGRVMEKAGMVYEGRLREHVYREGRFQDVLMYGLLRRDYAGA